MQPSNPYFWTRVNGRLLLRNLALEESVYSKCVFDSYYRGIIDEPVLIYYEMYDAESSEAFTFHSGNTYQVGDCYIRPMDVVLDLGANIGIFARFASDMGASKVYSFEPTMQNFELLLLNRPENCEAHRIAISNMDCQALDIAYKEDCPGGSSILFHEDGKLQTCMGMTVSTLIDQGIIQQPDFIKMDIEGAEVHAFDGIRDEHLIGAHSIAMEIHIGVIGQEGAAKIYNRLANLGFNSYTMFNPDENNIVWFVNQNKL